MNEVFLTMDPQTDNPTVVAEPSAAAVMIFRCLDYVNAPPTPEPYVLLFEPNFVGKYQIGPAYTPGAITPVGVMFSSVAGTYAIPGVPGPPVNVQEIKIRLQTGGGVVHPDDGYKYSVLMGGKVLDPRVVPR